MDRVEQAYREFVDMDQELVGQTHEAFVSAVISMASRLELLEVLYRAVEKNGGYNDMHDDVWEAMDALMHDDMRRRKGNN